MLCRGKGDACKVMKTLHNHDIQGGKPCLNDSRLGGGGGGGESLALSQWSPLISNKSSLSSSKLLLSRSRVVLHVYVYFLGRDGAGSKWLPLHKVGAAL